MRKTSFEWPHQSPPNEDDSKMQVEPLIDFSTFHENVKKDLDKENHVQKEQLEKTDENQVMPALERLIAENAELKNKQAVIQLGA